MAVACPAWFGQDGADATDTLSLGLGLESLEGGGTGRGVANKVGGTDNKACTTPGSVPPVPPNTAIVGGGATPGGGVSVGAGGYLGDGDLMRTKVTVF